MKKLKVTKDQIKKLIEMSKKMFPEYDLVYFDHDKIFLYPNVAKTPDLENISMSWFEFCMVNLATKVIKGIDIDTTGEDDIDDFDLEYRQICFGYLYPKMEEHPIDFLYGKFKKLKLK